MLSNIHAAKHVVTVSLVRCLFLRQEVMGFLCLILLHSVNMYGRVDIQMHTFLTTVLDEDVLSTSVTCRLTSTIIG